MQRKHDKIQQPFMIKILNKMETKHPSVIRKYKIWGHRDSIVGEELALHVVDQDWILDTPYDPPSSWEVIPKQSQV